MKRKSLRILSFLLCAAMLLGMLGCTKDTVSESTPSETTVPETTEPTVTEPSEQALYDQARAVIEEAANLDLTVTIEKVRTVGGETYTESGKQWISLRGIGTADLKASVQEQLLSGNYGYAAEEFYSEGIVYLVFEELPFSGEMSDEDYLSRFVPAVLLDSSLYGNITSAAGGSGTTKLSFTDPTEGESWALPESAELISATGTAVLNSAGALTRTDYNVSYIYGPTQIDLEISVSVSVSEATELANPLTFEESEYVTLEYIDTPRMQYCAFFDIMQAGTASYSAIYTLISQAGATYLTQQDQYDLCSAENGLMANIQMDITLQDFSGYSDTYSQTENYQDGTYILTADGEEAAPQKLAASVIQEYCQEAITLYLPFPDYLNSAEATDLGSVYYLEMTYGEEMAEIFGQDASSTLFGDPDLLNSNAESYKTNKMEYYLSIDKYTGLPVAFGYAFEGVHTIEGQEYPLSAQGDFCITLGSTTAYEAITGDTLPDEEPEIKVTPLFYHVTGENGQEMWLIGTIHVGDERTAYLPQEIYDALLGSDALAVEFDTDAFDAAAKEDESVSDQIMEAYFYSDGSTTKDHLDEEVYETAVKLLKATGNYYANAEYIKPYLWGQSIDNFYLQQGYNLQSEKGVDNRLMALARENNIEIRDVESGLFQIQMLTNFSDELQQILLEESMYSDSAAYNASVEDLFELWCAGDEAALREALSCEVDTSEMTEDELAEYEEYKDLLEEYNDAMSHDRNDGMLQVAIDYLESGETIFYAVGLAHLLDETNGLVDTLREAGYTVELVEFQ